MCSLHTGFSWLQQLQSSNSIHSYFLDPLFDYSREWCRAWEIGILSLVAITNLRNQCRFDWIRKEGSRENLAMHRKGLGLEVGERRREVGKQERK